MEPLVCDRRSVGTRNIHTVATSSSKAEDFKTKAVFDAIGEELKKVRLEDLFSNIKLFTTCNFKLKTRFHDLFILSRELVLSFLHSIRFCD